MNSHNHCPVLEADDRIGAEATYPASHLENEKMARRRFQKPTPFKEGNYWWLLVRDSSATDSRKRKREKLGDADLTFREAQKIADEKLRPMNHGLGVTGSAMKLVDFMFEIYKPKFLPAEVAPGGSTHLASSTRDCYGWMIKRYVEPDLGDKRLRDLTQPALEQYFSCKGSEVSYPTMSKIRDCLSSILRAAVHVEYLTKNPMEGLELPKDRRARRPKPTITPQELTNLVQIIDEPYASMVYVCAWTGLRVSELIGLKWRCVGADSITISERFCRGDWADPKTKASAATIPVAPEVIARLRRLPGLEVEVKAGTSVRKIKVVRKGGPDDLVFQSVLGGGPMNDQNILKRHLQPAARKLGIPFVCWRTLRTSFATWLCQAGSDPKSVQALMRHSRSSTTMDIYAQAVKSSQQRACQQLSAFAGGLPAAAQTGALDFDFTQRDEGEETPRSNSRSKTFQIN